METTLTAIGVCTCRGWAEFPQLRSIRCMGPWGRPFGCSWLRGPEEALTARWATRQTREGAVCVGHGFGHGMPMEAFWSVVRCRVPARRLCSCLAEGSRKVRRKYEPASLVKEAKS